MKSVTKAQCLPIVKPEDCLIP